MDERIVWASGHGIVLFALLAGIAFVSGVWGVVIALGPTAYLLTVYPYENGHTPQNVVVTHVVALIAGWVAYATIAHGITPTSIEPLSEPGLRIVGSALLAFIASTALFYSLNVDHPLAYVTTLTAAIGGFPTIQAFAIAGGVIFVVAGLQAARRKFGPTFDAKSGLFSDRATLR
jgi:hypothetical protein